MQLLDSEGWSESLATDNAPDGHQELVFTSFRNRLMPLLRYRSGDLGRVEQRESGLFLTDVVGRLHDIVPINGTPHATHHIQDVLDHRVGGIQEFQIDLRSTPPTLRVVVDSHGNEAHIASRVEAFWPSAFRVEFVQHGDLVRVGRHAKFRHVVTA
jgi:phenylacetate-CoA ligase